MKANGIDQLRSWTMTSSVSIVLLTGSKNYDTMKTPTFTVAQRDCDFPPFALVRVYLSHALHIGHFRYFLSFTLHIVFPLS